MITESIGVVKKFNVVNMAFVKMSICLYVVVDADAVAVAVDPRL